MCVADDSLAEFTPESQESYRQSELKRQEIEKKKDLKYENLVEKALKIKKYFVSDSERTKFMKEFINIYETRDSKPKEGPSGLKNEKITGANRNLKFRSIKYNCEYGEKMQQSKSTGKRKPL